MKVLIIALYDDNFGDMLIRTNFTQILKVVFHDLQIRDYEIDSMHLRDVCRERIESADLIMFAGGALFGLSYQHFHDHLFEILDCADACHVPVVFSSLGANNMYGDEESKKRLAETLHKDCVKAIAVRDNPDFFRTYTEGTDLEVHVTCDPAVWTRYTYAKDIEGIREGRMNEVPVVGINVVRGKLFKSNGLDWSLKDEENYLKAFSTRLEEAGFAYRFFTNGSVTDNNELLSFADLHEIPPEKVILPATTRELVQAVAQFDMVAAIRMHASIVSYAMGIPSVNLVWNNKIQHFYRNIGYYNRAIEVENWTDEMLLGEMKSMNDSYPASDYPSPVFLMSVYHFLYDTLKKLTGSQSQAGPMCFGDICRKLEDMQIPLEEDVIDLRVKVAKSETHYLKLSKLFRLKKKDIKSLEKMNQKLQEKNQTLMDQRDELKKELKRINQYKVIRLYKKLGI